MNSDILNFSNAEVNVEYKVVDIDIDDLEVKEFLFSLGCYKDEKITLISKISDIYTVSIKDARYSIDKELTECISVSVL